MSQPVTSLDDIRHIATISSNNDSTIGNLIAMAVDRVGQDGSITIEESRSIDTCLDVSEGFKFDSGYCAGAFVTDERRAMMQHDDPMILVTDYKISSVEQILPVLEMCARESRPLVIVAEEIEGQALAALIMNAMRGTLRVAAMKAPSYGEERREILDDIALSTGAFFISRESGVKLKELQLSHLGTADFIESTKYQTTIVGGAADHEAVGERVTSLKALIEQTDSMEECNRHQARVVRLVSGVAIIRVGGSTQVEMTEKKHRIEDALEAVRAAQDEGIVAGGGSALLKAGQSIVIISENGHSDLGVGAAIVRECCSAPIRQMALNSDESPDLIVNQVLASKQHEGWDFHNQELTNLLERGIIDPVKVTKSALKNAASCAGTLLTTNYGIIQTGE